MYNISNCESKSPQSQSASQSASQSDGVSVCHGNERLPRYLRTLLLFFSRFVMRIFFIQILLNKNRALQRTYITNEY